MGPRDHDPSLARAKIVGPGARCAVRRALFLEAERPGTRANRVGIQVHLRGPLDPRRLEAALAQLASRVPALRRTADLPAPGDDPAADARARFARAQVFVAPDVATDLPARDLSAHPVVQQDVELRDELHALLARPIPLDRAPLWRAQRFELAPDHHVLQVAVHRLVADRQGLPAFVHALLELYVDPDATPESEPAPESVAVTAPAAAEAARSYWQEKVRDPEPTLRLPADHARPAAPARARHTVRTSLPEATTNALARLGALDRVVLAGFAALLQRLGAASRVRLGVLEPDPSAAALPTAALRLIEVDLDAPRPPASVVQAVDAELAAAHAHAAVDYTELASALGAPLVQVGFEARPRARVARRYGDLEVSVREATPASTWDLLLRVEAAPAGAWLMLDYDPQRFRSETAERLLTQLSTLLDGFVASPQTPTSRLPLVTATERAELIHRWNRTDAPRPPGPLVPERIAGVARRQPDAIALGQDGAHLTYRDLRARAVQLASRLRAAGVQPGDGVALLVDRSFELVVGLLAILEARAAYIPLDPDHPAARNRRILDDAAPRAIVTRQASLPDLPSEIEAILVDDASLSVALPRFDPDDSDDVLEGVPGRGPDDLAYVIYTSGSTGQPKGVEITHGALDNLIRAMQSRLRLGGDDRWLALTTIAFDISVLELLLPLTVGGSVELGGPVLDPAALARRLDDPSVSHAQATPTLWRAIVEAGWSGRRALTVLVGGEALPRDLADALLARAGRVHNMYGPTETTVWSSAHLVTESRDAVPIGHPLDNTVMYVVDADGALAPSGAVGELWIGGAGLARGYFRQPALTAERFGPDPFLGPPRRIFRTGDLVRRRADGALEWVARTDAQVKVRGHRIELGEVEAALRQHASVEAAVAIARGEPAELVAYVAAPSAPPAQEVRAFLKDRLPNYMLPSEVVVLEELPTTPNGKVDRRALPAPGHGPLAFHRPPRDQAEREVAKIWCEVLARPHVPVDADLSDLGGHSLHCLQIADRLEALLGHPLLLPDLLRHPTVAAQAGWLREQSAWAPQTSQAVQLAPGRGAPLFLVCGIHLYAPLARALRHRGPVYGLFVPSERRALDAALADDLSVEDLAAEYRALVEATAPQGPYLVAGASFGGVLAYEIARQLVAAGRRVDLLAMFDSELPSARRRLAGRWLANRLEGLIREPRALSGRVRERWRARSTAPRDAAEERSTLSDLRDRIHDRLARAYAARAPTLEADAVLVRALDVPRDPGYALEADLGWGDLVKGNLHLLRAPGGHLSMLEPPHVDALADRLRAYL